MNASKYFDLPDVAQDQLRAIAEDALEGYHYTTDGGNTYLPVDESYEKVNELASTLYDGMVNGATTINNTDSHFNATVAAGLVRKSSECEILLTAIRLAALQGKRHLDVPFVSDETTEVLRGKDFDIWDEVNGLYMRVTW